MTNNTCYECGQSFSSAGVCLRCRPCMVRHIRRAGEAHAVVAGWVRKGLLPNLKQYPVACRDCGERADRWDHRDYSKPLHIAPVCHRCNHRRGTVVRIAA